MAEREFVIKESNLKKILKLAAENHILEIKEINGKTNLQMVNSNKTHLAGFPVETYY